MQRKYLVTGGAGFIGANFIRHLRNMDPQGRIINLDCLTYAGNKESLHGFDLDGQYRFVHANINDRQLLRELLADEQPDAIFHFAAESHVDRSIDGPVAFVEANIMGTFSLLEETRRWWREQSDEKQKQFRFIHVSTDEVFGSLGATGTFREESAYAPNSPYAATKAAADHLVRSYQRTYGLPTVTTHCSNNYGPYQFPEKLIPLMILNALAHKSLPVYGDGLQVRDWLYVEDHCCALTTVWQNGAPGQTYNIGGCNEKTNMDIVQSLCSLLDELEPRADGAPYFSQIIHVPDRPGHDRRYAINASKVEHELGWKPRESFETGLRKTVEWYLQNRHWCQRITDGTYRQERLGISL